MFLFAVLFFLKFIVRSLKIIQNAFDLKVMGPVGKEVENSGDKMKLMIMLSIWYYI